MPRLLRLCLLWLGLLLVRFSRELSDISSARKLCGRYLVKEIEKLCGHANWSQFRLGEETPFSRLIAQASEKVEAFSPYQFQSSQTAFPVRGRGTNPVSTSWEEAVNSWEMQSLPEYKDKKGYSPLDKTREFSSSHNINLYIHENAKFQKKSRNKTLSNLFWGNHPQRKRRGYSEKCCLTGCTKEELSIACLPYIDFKRLKEKRSSLVTKIY
ncbi:insulin-like peptide INSL6 [Pongo pygmaeus]|uniref:Insulin-like peptide INSL6 n=1 Tax=Pongo abelii TaxID=9601 RepID=H2PS82_PONAB|nr:insulin-like peptide INSL6 isoform X1 [Pongo abelii]XP_054356518.1 insulin-like peptide INSL6 [Pongo pygmaeus]PNJ81572.1 INSL6 isoform 2 [Pongo abelii]